MDYGTAAARLLLGATAHPGGVPLTRHLLGLLDLPAHAVVADVACGRGTTLRLLRAQGHKAVGVDLTATHVVGDGQQLPLRSGSYDAVLLECALSTFDHPERAIAEVARVLRPGGLLGLTDVTIEHATAEVTDAIARLTNARTRASYASLVEDAGLTIEASEDRHRDALTLVRRIRRRLPLSRTVRACEAAVRDGTLSYGLLIARR